MDTSPYLVLIDEALARVGLGVADSMSAGSGAGAVVTLRSEVGESDTALAVLVPELRGLVDDLGARWGQPRSLAMDGFVDPSLDTDRGLPLVASCGDGLIEMCGWAVGHRWVGCGIVRDRRGPALHLVAVVAERADPAVLRVPDTERGDWAEATWVERLAALTGWTGADRRSIDWQSVETRLGTALPNDYKQLAEHFGPGEFDEFLWLSTPDSSTSHHDLVAEAASLGRLAAADSGIRTLYHPYSVFPAPGGLLRWADSVQADQFFWLTDGPDSDQWPIVACGEDYDQWARFDGSTSEFIHRVLTDPHHPFSIAEFFDAHTFKPFE